MSLITRFYAAAYRLLSKLAAKRSDKISTKVREYDEKYVETRNALYEEEKVKKDEALKIYHELRAAAAEDRRKKVAILNAKGDALGDELLILNQLS